MNMLADVVWPSLFLGGRMFTWWIIVTGLAIEFCFVIWLTRATLTRACLMTVVINGLSAALGIIGIPLSGAIWEFIAMVTVMPLFHWGTFNPVTWAASCLLAALQNTGVEVGSLHPIFKVPWTWRLFWWIGLANMITVGLALASIMTNPPKT